MHPFVRRNFLPFGQLYHADWRGVSALTARPAFQGCFQLPNRGIAWSADSIQRQARPRLAAIALDL